jgi:hypothetical protein
MSWLTSPIHLFKSFLPDPEPKKPNITVLPELKDYSSPAPDSFWLSFPRFQIPPQPETSIDIKALASLVDNNSTLLLSSEVKRAKKCIEYLSNGAPAFQSETLGACFIKNSTNAITYGPSVTNTIASWVSKKFVAGPFSTPPLPNFRVNSILAVPQPNKTRVCINVSLPAGKSFNDNINSFDLEKIKMSSARNFGYSIIEAGPGCTIAKPDIVDAYKNVPAKIEDLRYQGFYWLGKYFIELRQMFGAKGAVQNFDILSNTVKTLALARSHIPSKFVHRQLDDVPIVGPKSSGWCEEFLSNYKKICSEINLILAEECKSFDKAFGCTTRGKVLGIYFDTTNQTWKLPDDKKIKTISAIDAILENSEVSSNAVPIRSPELRLFNVPLHELLQVQCEQRTRRCYNQR